VEKEGLMSQPRSWERVSGMLTSGRGGKVEERKSLKLGWDRSLLRQGRHGGREWRDGRAPNRGDGPLHSFLQRLSSELSTTSEFVRCRGGRGSRGRRRRYDYRKNSVGHR
jgi:hypothetical protein